MVGVGLSASIILTTNISLQYVNEVLKFSCQLINSMPSKQQQRLLKSVVANRTSSLSSCVVQLLQQNAAFLLHVLATKFNCACESQKLKNKSVAHNRCCANQFQLLNIRVFFYYLCLFTAAFCLLTRKFTRIANIDFVFYINNLASN